ncbi:hypothetical protein C2869_10510 [Saccharobesus litoralis]|uniref:Lipoprotein n=1 Tax=Saccharobesus litoralis TaxID=2172099 RepID=A0A2S0VRK6_9ALTE|nr:hypothetical protein C2869_10510 [Saccharobesus litoralis]
MEVKRLNRVLVSILFLFIICGCQKNEGYKPVSFENLFDGFRQFDEKKYLSKAFGSSVVKVFKVKNLFIGLWKKKKILT